MSVRAIFIDMDGTLLSTTNEISERNQEAINQLMNQGIKVFLATGRQYEITAPYHRSLGLNTPLICLNGAAIYDGRTGKALYTKPVNINEEQLFQITNELDYNVFVHTVNGLYCKQLCVEVQSWIKEGGILPSYVGELTHANYPTVLKYSIRSKTPCPHVSSLFKPEATVIDWNDGFELVAPEVSKWSAIQTLLKAYRISPLDVVTIGDGPNDVQMLKGAGMGVAMENGTPEIKGVADFVTGHHEEDGFASFVERFLIDSYAL